jgi:hypothetical protein
VSWRRARRGVEAARAGRKTTRYRISEGYFGLKARGIKVLKCLKVET